MDSQRMAHVLTHNGDTGEFDQCVVGDSSPRAGAERPVADRRFPNIQGYLWLILGPLWLIFPFSAVAVQVPPPNPDSRPVPAPWRPAFESINSAAPDSGTKAAQQPSVDPAQSQSNLGPPIAGVPVPNATAGEVLPGLSTGEIQATPAGANLPSAGDGPGITKITQTLDKLPNSAGQVWREYDITPYTSRVTNNENPQQAIIDWILRETGTEMWFNHPLGILSANRNQLYVYHTPEIQKVVRRVVDRFVRTRGQLQKIDVTLMTVANPNWRATSYNLLQSIDVRTPGVEAWMVSKESAALLQGQLARRGDAKTSSSGTLTNHDGQTFLLKKTRPVQFVSSLRWVPNQIPNHQPLMTNIEEGYSLSISCLSALDDSTIEAIIKCDVDQVEKLNPVKVNVPGADGSGQQLNLQIPQLVSWRLHERFRWPNDQVLLLSCGVVASLEPDAAARLPLLGLNSKNQRADALLFIEYRGPATEASLPRAADTGLVPIRPRR